MIKTVLGFDFGTKYIGVAVGYTSPLMAQPLTSLIAQKGEPPWKEIDTLIKTWSPDALIVGMPLNMDGSEQPMTQSAGLFSENLKQRFHLPIFAVDERLTTIEARARLFSSGGYKALQKKAIDSVSAQLIVEMWLESTRYE
ncbi:putative holliday junction resolvase [Candidatus Rickettsiella viridis]|uniref:Putative pre-16S rRNA nuclease n=1 Tax=Candidatus Rickettsiella viridis TaxID=676208 RepID=A0A2Z5UTQ1_9COXI|nr:Holliday junction resolvase RuvX [Candidatus Rickettsiella viridis]BBB14824.1 putative holliday junction resolvase [Candidatus Rickettsiella viridis]